MKEATGELNMTVITVVAIAAVAAFFYAFIWPQIQANIKNSTLCATATNCGDCETQNGKRICKCYALDSEEPITCAFQDDSEE